MPNFQHALVPIWVASRNMHSAPTPFALTLEIILFAILNPQFTFQSISPLWFLLIANP